VVLVHDWSVLVGRIGNSAERAKPAYKSNHRTAPMSRLEAFRKQAKQLVRWHREANHSVGGRIRGLPRYRELTDIQALALAFPLSEAQEVIAREAGFESWAELKLAMEDEPPAPKQLAAAPVIKATIPIVLVSNVSIAAAFFRNQLGFSIDFLHGNPAFYAGVSRNGVALHLRFVHEPVMTPEMREKESLLAAFIAVENVKALFEEYKHKGVPGIETPRREPWGGPMFKVRDPDGNWICFCED
jgi:catechol 2,3-dioxygenase-like lactoylglutathione lyase family enzyme